MCLRYWSASPPPVRLTLGNYPSMDCPRPPVGIPDSSLIFKVCTAAAQAKFWVISAVLRLAGYTTLSTKLWSGWQVEIDLLKSSIRVVLCTLFSGNFEGNIANHRKGGIFRLSVSCQSNNSGSPHCLCGAVCHVGRKQCSACRICAQMFLNLGFRGYI